MKKLYLQLKDKLLEFLNSIKKEHVYTALPEYNITPESIKNDFIIPISDIDRLIDILNKKDYHHGIDYILNIDIIDADYNINKDYSIQIKTFYYKKIIKYLNNIKPRIISTIKNIQSKLIEYNITKELEQVFKNEEISRRHHVELYKEYENYKSYINEYKIITSKAEKLIKNLKNIIFNSYNSKYNNKSIVANYINECYGKGKSAPGIFDNDHIKESTKSSHLYEKMLESSEYKKKSGIITEAGKFCKNFVRKIKIAFLKIYADTILTFNKDSDLKLEQIKELATLQKQFAELKLEYNEFSEQTFHNINRKSEQLNNKKRGKLRKDYSISVQDNIIIDYLQNKPLSVNIENKQYSLLNGFSLTVIFILLMVLSLFITNYFSKPNMKLFPITETAGTIPKEQEMFGSGNGDTSTLNDIMLSSLYDEGLGIDKKFLSEIRLTTSIGMDKQKDIRNNIEQRIFENQDIRNDRSFNESIEDIIAEEKNYTYNTGEDKDSTSKEGNTDDPEDEPEENKSIDTMTLPDYSEYRFEILPHELDLSIQNRPYTIKDFKPAIIKLQRKFDNWYHQTKNDFFPKFEDDYEISKLHQERFLGFIKSLDPVKIFEAFNYQYQNYPYLLDRIIRDDMPDIFTSVSTDARELGIWSSDGILLFYDISSFDKFRQTLIHELTHDLVERVYSTKIIFEGITEMLALNMSSYIFGEGFSNYKNAVRTAQYLYNINPKALIDYYIGRRFDDKGNKIDLFDEAYLKREFLSTEVQDVVSEKNATIIGSMLDIPFSDLLLTNKNIIPLNPVINSNKNSTPLVLQSDFNNNGLNLGYINDTQALVNLEFIIEKLETFVNKEKKIDYYFLLVTANTMQLLKSRNKLTAEELSLLEKLIQRFLELQAIIKEKNLLYEENKLSKKSKEILEDNNKPSFSDKKYQEDIKEYQEKGEEMTAPLSKDIKNRTENSDLKDQIRKDTEQQVKNALGNKSSDSEKLGHMSDKELSLLKKEAMKQDIEDFSKKISNYEYDPESLYNAYTDLKNKWGPGIVPMLDEKIESSLDKLNIDSVEEIFKLPNSTELLKKIFAKMLSAVENGDKRSKYYTDPESNKWFDILSLIATDKLILDYYDLLIKLLKDPKSEINIEKVLINIKRIASYINTQTLYDRYKKDLIETAKAQPLNKKGLKRLSELNKHLMGTTHPYLKNAVLDRVEKYISEYIINYPENNFMDILLSDILKRLNSTELYNIFEKALYSEVHLGSLLTHFDMYKEEYSRINLKPLADKFVEYYFRQLNKSISYIDISYLLKDTYKVEKILLNVFGEGYADYIHSDTMTNFYERVNNIFYQAIKDLPTIKRLSHNLKNLKAHEKHIALFNAVSIIGKEDTNISHENSLTVFGTVFLDLLNLYPQISYELCLFFIESGKDLPYAYNLFSITNTKSSKSIYLSNSRNQKKSLIDYISNLSNNNHKTYLVNKLINNITPYMNKYYIVDNDIILNLCSVLSPQINIQSYETLVKTRYHLRDTGSSDEVSIIQHTDILFLLLHMVTEHKDLLAKGFNDDIQTIIDNLTKKDNNNITKDNGLVNLYIEQSKLITEAYQPKNKLPDSGDIEKLYYQTEITGMLIDVLYSIYKSNINFDMVISILNICGVFYYNEGTKITKYRNYLPNISNIFISKMKHRNYSPSTLIQNNKYLYQRIEKMLLENPSKHFHTFFLFAYEDWFWKYNINKKSELDEQIFILVEDPTYYETPFSNGFIKRYFTNIFIENEDQKYIDLRQKFLTKRNYLIPFLTSNQEEMINCFVLSFKHNNTDMTTFLFRLVTGTYLTGGNYIVDFFVEGELVRKFIRNLFLEDESNYKNLFYSLPFRPLNEFGYEEELRRNMINIYYHIFKTLPPEKDYLYALLDIYKDTIKKLLDNESQNNMLSNKDRIEEEFSKIANLMYLINEESVKEDTVEYVYPLVERFITLNKHSNEYLFADYVLENIENPDTQIKWNILDSIKSYAFNYKSGTDRVYEKLFTDIDPDLLLSYRNYLIDILNNDKDVSETEFKVLLNTLTQLGVQEEQYGLKLLKDEFNSKYEEVKNEVFKTGKSESEDIKKVIRGLRNLISYSSNYEDLGLIKNNIIDYSKKVSEIFRDIITSSYNDKDIRLLVNEMATEIIKLPPEDKAGLFVIFTNLILDYSSISNTEFKYYTTLIEYIITDVLKNVNAGNYYITSEMMENIGSLVIYFYRLMVDDPSRKSDIEFKFESLLIMYSYYLNIKGVTDEFNSTDKYILGIYAGFDRKYLSREEEAIIASNMFKMRNKEALSVVNEYLKAPVFRRYLEEISAFDRKIIYDKTQDFIDWLSSFDIDYHNPMSNEYLIEMLNIRSHLNEIENNEHVNYSIANEILKRKNLYVTRLVIFFTETYGYKFSDPADKNKFPY